MKIGKRTVKIFKIRNRKGYAALCWECLTEGSTQKQALARMVKAVTRLEKKAAKAKGKTKTKKK